MPLIQKDYNLSNLTTFRTGGSADFFVGAHTVEEIREALLFARDKDIPLRIIGGGSNLLMGETPFRGLLLQPRIKGIEVRQLPFGDGVSDLQCIYEVVAGAGESWDDLVGLTVAQGLYGLENLSLIPGTVGAAPVQNIGAYGSEAKDTIAFVEGIDCESGEVRRLDASDCAFGYRTSIFKQSLKGKMVITRVGFRLIKGGRVNIGYKDFTTYFEGRFSGDISAEEVRAAVIAIRTQKMPDLSKVGTAGSFFKNPIITRAHYNELALRYPDLPCFTEKSAPDGDAEKELVKVPLGYILDKICNLRGVREGNVGTWPGQALVLVNYGGATGQEICTFAEKIAARVKEKTDITIEWEVEWWG